MADIFPKWIYEDGYIIIRKATYHKDIAQDPTKVKGGGMFYFHSDTKSFILYGSSHDFGKANPEDIKKAIANKAIGRKLGDDRYGGYNILFTEADNYAESLLDILKKEIS